MQTQGAVLDELERVFMHGETKGKLAAIYSKALSNTHTCADAMEHDPAGGHHQDVAVHFSQVSALCITLHWSAGGMQAFAV
jgi:hypothetical protein